MTVDTSSLVFENLEEYTKSAHLLVIDSVFGICTRQESTINDNSTSKKNNEKLCSSSKCPQSILSDEIDGNVASNGSTVIVDENHGMRDLNDGGACGVTFTVTNFKVIQCFTRKGSMGQTPAAVICSHCDKQLGPYINFGALVGHARHCSRNDLHICHICNERFTRRSLYDKHVFRMHGIGLSDKKFICATCGKGFENESLLHKHLKRTKCGLSEKLTVSDSIGGANKRKSKNNDLSMDENKRAKVTNKKTPSCTISKDRNCPAVALVNHSGHMDWLLSCNTLVCSEEGMSLQEDYCSKEKDNKGVHVVSGCHTPHGQSHAQGAEVHKDIEVSNREKGSDKFDASYQCPFGCFLSDMDFEDGLCDHLSNATRVKHADHWDYLVNDRLLHVSQRNSKQGEGQAFIEDHGSFEFLETDLGLDG